MIGNVPVDVQNMSNLNQNFHEINKVQRNGQQKILREEEMKEESFKKILGTVRNKD